MMEHADAIVVGGGLVGPAVALGLAAAGWRVVVLDRDEAAGAPADGGRAWAIAATSRRMLGALGVWDRVAAEAAPMHAIRIGLGGPDGTQWCLGFDDAGFEDPPMASLVPEAALRAAMAEAAGGLDWRRGVAVIAQEPGPGAMRCRLADGTILSAPVLIGADGRAGETARRAGIARLSRDYDQSAVVAAIRTERPAQATGWQVFHPGGPLAVLPMGGDRAAIVWSETTERAAALLAAPAPLFEALLSRAHDGPLGRLRLDGPRQAHRLGLSLAVAMVAPRLALAGDAAHAIHPLAGQGLNLGLRDAAALVEVLVEAGRRGLDPGAADVLDAYAVWRRSDTMAMAAATDGLNRLFRGGGALSGLGGVGLRALERVPALKRLLLAEATGTAGTLPALLRGVHP